MVQPNNGTCTHALAQKALVGSCRIRVDVAGTHFCIGVGPKTGSGMTHDMFDICYGIDYDGTVTFRRRNNMKNMNFPEIK